MPGSRPGPRIQRGAGAAILSHGPPVSGLWSLLGDICTLKIVLAFRAFFALLFGGKLPADLVAELGLAPKSTAPAPKPAPPAPVVPQVKPTDGALQLLGLLQREGRVLDFFMEDIAPYSDDQIGAAARDVHEKTREVLIRHFAPAPVIDAVEGSTATAPKGAGLVKFIGNVPATGAPGAGVLRHRGWKATTANLPTLASKQDLTILAPAEIELE